MEQKIILRRTQTEIIFSRWNFPRPALYPLEGHVATFISHGLIYNRCDTQLEGCKHVKMVLVRAQEYFELTSASVLNRMRQFDLRWSIFEHSILLPSPHFPPLSPAGGVGRRGNVHRTLAGRCDLEIGPKNHLNLVLKLCTRYDFVDAQHYNSWSQTAQLPPELRMSIAANVVSAFLGMQRAQRETRLIVRKERLREAWKGMRWSWLVTQYYFNYSSIAVIMCISNNDLCLALIIF